MSHSLLTRRGALYRFLPLEKAYVLELTLLYPFAFIGMVLWLRTFFRPFAVRLFGGFLFAFSTFNIAHFTHTNMTWVNAHTPWLLWCISILLRDRCLKAQTIAWAGIAVLTASQVLLGHPPMLWISLTAEMGYAISILGSWRNRRSNFASCSASGGLPRMDRKGGVCWKRSLLAVGLLGTAYGVGSLLSAVQVLPTLDIRHNSHRFAVTYEFASFNSLQPVNLIQWLSPYLIDDRAVAPNTAEGIIYLGAVPLVLFVWAALSWKKLERLRYTMGALLIFSAIAFLMMLGNYTPFYRLHYCLPVVGGFRCPARYVAILQLCTAVGAAIGLRLLLARSRRMRQPSGLANKAVWALILLSAASTIAATAVLSSIGRGDRLPGWPALAAGPLLMLVAGALVILSARRWRWAPLCLVVFAAFDLGLYDLTLHELGHTSMAELKSSTLQPPASEGELRPFRIQTRYRGCLYTVFDYRLAGAYLGLQPNRRLNYWNSLGAQRVAGVKWSTSWKAEAEAKNLADRDSYDQEWVAIPDPLPFARCVTKTLVSANPHKDIDAIPLKSTALVDSPVDLVEGPPGSVTSLTRRPGRIQLEVQCPSRQLLVIAESNYPGWTCWIDDKPVEVLRVNGDFMGSVVEAGTHHVLFEFQPACLRYGRWLSLAGLAVVSIVVGVGLTLKGHPVQATKGYRADSSAVK